jgi:hypothetical protein
MESTTYRNAHFVADRWAATLMPEGKVIMQRRASSFNGYTIEAVDGNVGVICDLLFDDSNWSLRWFVINTGSWLSNRQILIHPSELEPPDIRHRAFPVALTRVQVEASPEISSDAPLCLQMDQGLNIYCDYSPALTEGVYGIDRYGLSGDTAFGSGGLSSVRAAPTGDPHLRSLTEVTGYHIHALDGDIGHLEDFLIDDESWRIDYAVIDTKNWGFGKHVLVSPAEIKEINWAGRNIHLELTCYKIKCGTSWTEPDWSDRAGG